MMKEAENTDKLIREKLEGFAEEPPAFVWDEIQGQLAATRRKKRMTRYSWAAVAAMLVLAFVGGWYFNETTENSVQQVAEREMEKPDREENAGTEDGPSQSSAEERTEPREKESGSFLAGSSESKSTPRQSEEIKTMPAGEQEDNLLVTAERFVMERVERVDAKLTGQKQTVSLAEKETPRVESGLSAFEREVVNENLQRQDQFSQTPSRWKMGLNVSPGYSSYSSSHSATYASNMTYEEAEGNGNVSGGFSVQYKTGKRLRVESGVYYAQNGQQTGSSPQMFGGRAEADYVAAPTEKLYFNTAVDITGSRMAMNSTAGVIEFDKLPEGTEIAANLETTGTFSNSLLTQGELSQVFDFVEIPFYLRYLLVDSKLDVEVMGGLNAGLVVGNNAFMDNEYGVQKIGSTRDISTVNVSGTMGVGVTYALGEHISLAVEPRLNYYMHSINRNPEIDFRPYRVGVYTGLYYEF